AAGQAARIREEAEGYRAQVVARAEGETARFLALLEEYRKAPELMRERLYLETMEEVLANTGKALVDVENGGSVMFLPLDKLLERSGSGAIEGAVSSPPAAESATGRSDAPAPARDTGRDRLRSREVR